MSPLRLEAGFDRLLRIIGLLVAAALGAVVASYEVVLSNLFIHGFRVPVAILLVILLNPAAVLFATVVTSWRFSGLGPAITWCLVWFTATIKTHDGDWLVLPNNWIGILIGVIGPVVLAYTVYMIVMRPSHWSLEFCGRSTLRSEPKNGKEAS